jgi:hypothetical protein
MAARLCTEGQQEFAGRIVGFIYILNCNEFVFLIIQTPKNADALSTSRFKVNVSSGLMLLYPT